MENNTTHQQTDRRLGLIESLREQPQIYISWLITIAVIMLIYFNFVGFGNGFNRFLGIILMAVLVSNMLLSGLDSIDVYQREIVLYEYVEANARAMLPFGIALSALIIAAGETSKVLDKKFLILLLIATMCFVSVLTIIWMPKDSGTPIRILRDVKTAILTLGGITVIALVGHFVEIFQFTVEP